MNFRDICNEIRNFYFDHVDDQGLDFISSPLAYNEHLNAREEHIPLGRLQLAYRELQQEQFLVGQGDETYSLNTDHYREYLNNEPSVNDLSWAVINVTDFKENEKQIQTLVSDVKAHNQYNNDKPEEAKFAVQTLSAFGETLLQNEGKLLLKAVYAIVNLLKRLLTVFEALSDAYKLIEKLIDWLPPID
jgi:hypothetical protein